MPNFVNKVLLYAYVHSATARPNFLNASKILIVVCYYAKRGLVLTC